MRLIWGGVWLVAVAGALAGSAVRAEPGPDATAATSNQSDRREAAQAFVGDYVVAGVKTQTAKRDAAIEDLIGELNVLIRPIARQKLRDGNPIAKRLSIDLDGDALTVAFDGKRDVASIDGTKTKIVGIQGDSLDYHVKVGDTRLRQVYSGARGGRSNNMRHGRGDRLVISVEMTSQRLPKPLRYRLTYRRK